MLLGIELGLGPGHTVLDGDPASPPQKGGAAHQFSAHVLWPNGWMDQDATWYGVALGPGHIVLDGDPAPLLPQKGAQQQPLLGPPPPTEMGTTAAPTFGGCLLWPKYRPSQQLLSSCYTTQ